jgi:hypothetical protein
MPEQELDPVDFSWYVLRYRSLDIGDSAQSLYCQRGASSVMVIEDIGGMTMAEILERIAVHHQVFHSHPVH